MANEDASGRDGFALVAVLGLLLVVSAILLPFSLSARLRALTTGNELRAFEDQKLAQALASYVAAKQMSGGGRGGALPTDENASCRWGENRLEVRIQDHAGLIDLNAAGADLLNLGFQSLGYSGEEARSLSLGVLRYRRIGDMTTGAKLDLALDPAGLKHAAFEDVAELHDFLALRAVSVLRLAGTFTVHTQTGTLQPDQASDELRQLASAGQGRSMPFLVNNAGPRRALTVVVGLRRGERLDFGYAGIFRVGNGAPVLDAAIPGLEEFAGETGLPGRPAPCLELLGPTLAQTVGEMIL